MIKTNKIKRLVLGLFFLFPVLVGCSSKLETISTDYFIFELNHKEKHATALALTELGKEQEVLVVPQFVKNLPVRHIGKPPKYFQPIKIKALKLTDHQKKIYLPYSLDGQNWMTTDTTVEAILTLANIESFDYVLIGNSFPEIKLYFMNESPKLNTFFMFNFEQSENEGYYWMDYINGNNQYIVPLDLIRANYTFAGWYYEEECTNVWNNEFPTSENEKLTLYAKWI